jgi:hypothetical protein
VRPPRLGTALHATRLRIDDDRRRVPVAHLALSSDLLEAVTSFREICQDTARNPIFDLHATCASLGRIAADQEAGSLNRLLR